MPNEPHTSHLEPRTRVQFLPGVGPRRAEAFERLGCPTISHLLRHYPREWLDATRFVPIRGLRPGELLTVTGVIRNAASIRTRGGRSDLSLTIADDTGTLNAYFFGQSFLARTLKPGSRVVVSGEFDPFDRRMLNPLFEVVEGDLETLLHAGRLVPVYALTKGLTARGLRGSIRAAIEAVGAQLVDPVPPEVLAARSLGPLAEALEQIHFPDSHEACAKARHRLAFEELFLLQMVMEIRRAALRVEGSAIALPAPGELSARVRAALPFTLTNDQEGALVDIHQDLALARPMHRLVIGDVGSGKTVVALLAAMQAVEAGHQAALLAPTEILARQHGATLVRMISGTGAQVLVLTGATPAAERRQIQTRLDAGEALLLVGTHALLEKKVRMPKLALAIVDEQHRFGVRQRASLTSKAHSPHLLVLTATPIPRTLQLAWFGDLDLSVIRSRPSGRGRLVTRVVDEGKRPQVLGFLAKELAAGRQAYVVVPAVEESPRAELKAAETEVELLRSQPVLRAFRFGLLHGRMKPEDKQSVMAAFKAGELHVLVATTVVEVGVDVPNATVMLVENAERFGLTQLHQLRGRVGRGEHRSVCVFAPSPTASAQGRERLAVMATTEDGFELAEADLRLRGPGELWGTRQSGLPRLKLADLFKDEALLLEARESARAVVMADPQLLDPTHAELRATLRREYTEALEMALAG